MRALHLTVVALFAVATFIFAIQNLQIVTVSFLGLSATAPMAIVACIVYLLGMATGGSVFALLRWSLEGARQRRAAAP